MSRLITALALFVLCAGIFCTVAGSVLVRQADDRQEVDRRNALLGAITMRQHFDYTSFDSKSLGELSTFGIDVLRVSPGKASIR